mmetsp:Transcript_28306/g.37676  ORF Transcript_28306/g.37676 Transcript_28306/m.37676 type:complete len:81 (-) Transcript_28306:1274-1516(-)
MQSKYMLSKLHAQNYHDVFFFLSITNFVVSLFIIVFYYFFSLQVLKQRCNNKKFKKRHFLENFNIGNKSNDSKILMANFW